MDIRKQLDEIIKVSNEVEIVNKVLMYFNNTRPDEIVEMLFGEVFGGYGEEWAARYQQGFHVFWNRLDEDNKQKIVDAAIERYG
jgi:hypothetical protein